MNETIKPKSTAKNVLPYSSIVGQKQLKLALELSYIEPRISGVLVSGERGSGKSTTVRSFANLVYGELPVTLPINATEDRVIGGWDLGELLKNRNVWKDGLLKQANDKMLYVDEVNLLDDHIVNIILDVTASGLLTVQREGMDAAPERVIFSLVGTMNPEEGMLRPQLLDRFGLMVDVKSIADTGERLEVLKVVLTGEQPKGTESDTKARARLATARSSVARIGVDKIVQGCVELADKFNADGSRGEYTLALAARALAASEGRQSACVEDLVVVAPLALQHRRKMGEQRAWTKWTDDDSKKVKEVLGLPIT